MNEVCNRINFYMQMKNGILIEPIDTKAMHQALAAGRTPFALLKPSKGVPVLVKVQFAPGSKHVRNLFLVSVEWCEFWSLCPCRVMGHF